jgi:hypothetical protein
LGDICFVMMTPVSQEMGPPVNPGRFIRGRFPAAMAHCPSSGEWLL